VPKCLLSLRSARDQRDDARLLIRAGTDPSVQRKIAAGEQTNTFKALALEWLHLLDGGDECRFTQELPSWRPDQLTACLAAQTRAPAHIRERDQGAFN
jgi:hypothetical protein